MFSSDSSTTAPSLSLPATFDVFCRGQLHPQHGLNSFAYRLRMSGGKAPPFDKMFGRQSATFLGQPICGENFSLKTSYYLRI